MNAVTFEDFSYHYPKGGKGLDNINLSIPSGSFTVLTGANGGGKTSMCLAMTGLVPHFFGGRMAGRVLIRGQETTNRPVAETAQHVGLVMEDYESQLVSLTVFDEVAFAMENQGVAASEIRERVAKALDAVGLAGLEERELSQLSGGQKQRLAVASVLASEPELLVLDEPASALDPEGAEEIYALLAKLNQEKGITIVVAEHDLARVLAHASQLVVMAEGKVAFAGTPSEAFTAMLQDKVYAEAVPALYRLKSSLETDRFRFSEWKNADQAAIEIMKALKPSRRLSLSA
jgi:energy-coupling factor transport system ATP-binding protein